MGRVATIFFNFGQLNFCLSIGLGFRPMPETANVESTLIYYRANDKGSVLKWASIIDEFLDRKFYRVIVDNYHYSG